MPADRRVGGELKIVGCYVIDIFLDDELDQQNGIDVARRLEHALVVPGRIGRLEHSGKTIVFAQKDRIQHRSERRGVGTVAGERENRFPDLGCSFLTHLVQEFGKPQRLAKRFEFLLRLALVVKIFGRVNLTVLVGLEFQKSLPSRRFRRGR